MTVSPQDVYRRNDTVLSNNFDGEMILMDIRSESYFEFNPTATRIWEKIDGKRPVSEVCRELAAEYGTPLEDIEGDVVDMIEQFEKSGFVSKETRT